MLPKIALVALLPFLFLAGCTGGGDDPADEGPKSPTGEDDSGNRKFTGKESKIVDVKGGIPQEYGFTPETIEVAAGETVGVRFENAGNLMHEFTIREAKFNLFADKKGATDQASFVAPAAGEYEFACYIPGHYEGGMKGTLVVS